MSLIITTISFVFLSILLLSLLILKYDPTGRHDFPLVFLYLGTIFCWFYLILQLLWDFL